MYDNDAYVVNIEIEILNKMGGGPANGRGRVGERRAPHVATAAVHDPVVAVEGQLVAQQVQQARLGAELGGLALELAQTRAAALAHVPPLPSQDLRPRPFLAPKLATGVQKNDGFWFWIPAEGARVEACRANSQTGTPDGVPVSRSQFHA